MIYSFDILNDPLYLFLNFRYGILWILFIFLLAGALKLYWNYKNEPKKMFLPLVPLLLVLGVGNVVWSFGNDIKEVKIGADLLSKLGEAETTLHRLEIANKLVKSPTVDPKLAEAWIVDMRKVVDSGEVTYGDFYTLAASYNDLKVGQEMVRRWFKDNPSESIKVALMNESQSLIKSQGGEDLNSSSDLNNGFDQFQKALDEN